MDDVTLARYNSYRDNPWKFLTECVFTRDAVDSENPVKLFPNYDYIRFIVKMWEHENKLAIPKSRRMTMSWTFIALTVWDIVFHPGREWAFVSKKEDDSQELVSRAAFIFNKIPPALIPKSLLPKIDGGRMKKSPPELRLDFGDENHSYIRGFPMGADQLRQYTFSGVLGDETAFWPDAENFYTGTKPTIDGGGKMILISSRAPGFFKKIVFDKINHKGNNFSETPPSVVKSPMQGVEVWKNPMNGFAVIDLHYTAHPDKRAPEFKEALKMSLPLHQYMREYEKNWETFSGMPIYPNFRKDLHLASTRLMPHMGLPLLIGWDFGLTPSAVLTQLQGNSLKVLHEWVSQNEGIKTFAPKVMGEINTLYPSWSNPYKDHYHFIDPAGFQRAQTDARTCAQEMEESAPIVNIAPGPVGFAKRINGVEHFLLHVERDSAGIELDPLTCPVLIEGFAGGYRYADSQADIESQKPEAIKNKYSHPHDALQYVCYGARQKSLEMGMDIDIPPPSYSFTKEHTPRKELNYGRTYKGS